MSIKENNMAMLNDALGNTILSDSEKRSFEWLAGLDIDTVKNISRVIKELRTRGAGRKKTIDMDMVQEYKKNGFTQEETARYMEVSLSTIRRNWNTSTET